MCPRISAGVRGEKIEVWAKEEIENGLQLSAKVYMLILISELLKR